MMPWEAPAAGYIDNRGALRCAACATEDAHRERPVWGDQHFSEDDKCECCGCVLRHYRTSEYVKVSWDAGP